MAVVVPQHYQSKYDSACGPMCIRMVADYYNEREMTASEWLRILDITMKNNIWRESGTKKEDIIRAFRNLHFKTQNIKGNNFEARIESVRKAINQRHPVVIYCRIKRKYNERPYLHFAVVVDIDDDHIYVRDPYPRKRKSNKPRKIPLKLFELVTPSVDKLVWGKTQWGVEVIK